MTLGPKLTKGVRLLRNPHFLRAYAIHGVAASLEHQALPDRAYATVVDIGAHTGQFSLLARALYPDAMIYAFEPLPKAAAKYRQVFAHDPRTRLYEAAIAPTVGDRTFYLGDEWDAGSLLPSAWGSPRGIRVHAAPLAAFLAATALQSPALLKLDVQGYEVRALEGCRSLLPHFDEVIAELMLHEAYVGQALAADIIVLLREEGFQLAGIDSLGRQRRRIVRFDGIFSRTVEMSQSAAAPESNSGAD